MNFPTFTEPLVAGSVLQKLSDSIRAATLLAGAGIHIDRTREGQRVSLRDGLARPSRRRLFEASLVEGGVAVADGRVRGVVWGESVSPSEPAPESWLADEAVAGGIFDLEIGDVVYCVAALVTVSWDGSGPLAGQAEHTNTGGEGGRGGAGGGGGGGGGGAAGFVGGVGGGVGDFSGPQIFVDPQPYVGLAAGSGAAGGDGAITGGGGGDGGSLGGVDYEPFEDSDFLGTLTCDKGGHGGRGGVGAAGGSGGIGADGLPGGAGSTETVLIASELTWRAAYTYADPATAIITTTPPSAGELGVAIAERTPAGILQHQLGAILFPSLPTTYRIGV